jgi:hypothetical protein
MRWVIRARVSDGTCVRFAIADSSEEADAIASSWEGGHSTCLETGEDRGEVTVEVRHQKILDDWSPKR